MRWNFPPTGGGVSQGFNDSGEEFFRANVMAHVVREIIQNSLDAKNPRYPDRLLPRSACVGCPYHTNMEWKWLKENDPKSFQDAVFIDKAIRDVPKIRGTLRGEGYLHRDRKSLDSADFDQTETYENFIASECEGLCGI